ncbi:hypothetical protein K493DRAFT_335195 [Basidiobolus meristosporus CBS 931.73]|uniref:Myb-like domain-containing protein n=1 Tax=Basidiobolus meristosporus CBS 931.73 TaxID=1314790 RepID=A0A1Y1YS57_9FUNG|nr:hypothetical protein K493DRAFT_335195 [Basidiobolus meristosporus CBS 931.73]|eukprot:ORY00860.1 hypothetical protein K493DRAFT_335195 [Basidiobolus meristosporus CBS 931.73]
MEELMATSGRSWETAETKLLMDLRREMDHEFRVVKRNAILWKKLSDRMNTAGYSRTDKQCKEKWKNLLSEYKRTEGQKDVCEGEQQRIFPYYNHIKNILVKQPGSTLSSILDSPPPHLDNQSSNSPYHPAYNRFGQLNIPDSAERQSSSHYSYSNGPLRTSSTPDHFRDLTHSSPLRQQQPQPSHHWHSPKAPNVDGASVIYEVLGLMRQEITERRRWEEQVEARQLESRRREEAREQRREKRERERARRQRYYTQLLTSLAAQISPNASEFLPNRSKKSSNDTEKSAYTTST